MRIFLLRRLPALAALLLLGAGLGVAVNETLAEPRVAYLGWTREGQLLRLREAGREAAAAPAPLAAAPAGIPAASDGKLLVHVFYSSACPDCKIFRDKILPDLQSTFADYVVFQEYDTSSEENVKRLFAFLDAYQVKQDRKLREATLKMFMYNRYLLGTDAAVGRGLVEVAEALAAYLERAEGAP